jgi:hypothetical protein
LSIKKIALAESLVSVSFCTLIILLPLAEAIPDGTTSAHLTLVAVAMDGHGKPLANTAKDGIPQAKNAKSVRIAVRDLSTGKLGTTEVGLTAQR